LERAALAAAVVMVGVTAGAVPARAQAPDLTVEPSSGLTDGQEVTVTVNGPQVFVTQCDAHVVANPTLDALLRLCGGQVTVQGDARPAAVGYVVRSTFTSFTYDTVDCGAQAGDCVISVAALGGSGFASVPITIEPPVFTVALPDEPLADGAQVQVTARGTPGETVTVAQCASPAAPVLADSRCGPPRALVIGDDGRAVADVTVSFDVATGAGPLDCQVERCSLAAFDEGGALLRNVPITVQAPLAITASPAAGLADGGPVLVDVTGYRDRDLELYQCAAGAGSESIARYCRGLGVTAVPSGSAPVQRAVSVKESFTPAMGDPVTCGDEPGDCVVAVGTSGSPQWEEAPISFARMTLSPASTGLLDGQPVTLSASGLPPDVSFWFVRCDPAGGVYSCEADSTAPVVTTDADGNLSFATTAVQRFTSRSGRPVYCRDQCTMQLRRDLPGVQHPTVGYAMADGSVTASPAAGLSDGDTVTLTGTDLMASYDGPAFWFFPSTGGWAVGQCGAPAIDDPTIVGFFTHCTVASPGMVDVPGSTASVDVAVASTFTSILGEEVDCTTGPGACTLALGRIEQDGSVSVHFAPPLSFG
jgi:hypothetical protein